MTRSILAAALVSGALLMVAPAGIDAAVAQE
jgi:hypothetical protein